MLLKWLIQGLALCVRAKVFDNASTTYFHTDFARSGSLTEVLKNCGLSQFKSNFVSTYRSSFKIQASPSGDHILVKLFFTPTINRSLHLFMNGKEHSTTDEDLGKVVTRSWRDGNALVHEQKGDSFVLVHSWDPKDGEIHYTVSSKNSSGHSEITMRYLVLSDSPHVEDPNRGTALYTPAAYQSAQTSSEPLSEPTVSTPPLSTVSTPPLSTVSTPQLSNNRRRNRIYGQNHYANLEFDCKGYDCRFARNINSYLRAYYQLHRDTTLTDEVLLKYTNGLWLK